MEGFEVVECQRWDLVGLVMGGGGSRVGSGSFGSTMSNRMCP